MGAVEPVDGLGRRDALVEDVHAQRTVARTHGLLRLLDGGQDLPGVGQEEPSVQAQP